MNKTILFATHNRELANKADYKLSISNGNIKELMAKNDFQFTNFKIHSQFSICEGAVKIDELRLLQKKIKAVGLCDSFNLMWSIRVCRKISKVKLQPLIGSQN